MGRQIVIVFLGLLVAAEGRIAQSVHGQSDSNGWMNFRGNHATAESTVDQIPLKWDADTNIHWKTPLPGPGASSPIVVAGNVLVTSYTGYGTQRIVDRKTSGQKAGNIKKLARHLICLNRSDGQIRWQKTVDNSKVDNEDAFKGYITYHGYATNTPISDGQHVYAFFGKAGIVCYDLQGNQRWIKTFAGKPNKQRWGSAASPILFDQFLIVNAIDECGKILAMNKTNGEIAWELDAGTRMAYSTPALVATKSNGTELIVAVPEKVIGINPKNGKQKWFVNTKLLNEVNPSVIVEDDVAYIFGGYRGVGSLAVRAGGRGDVTDSNVLWESKETSYVATPVLFDKHLYWLNKRGLAYCLDAQTGQRVYQSRVAGMGDSRGIKVFASMVRAQDQIFALSRNAGLFVWSANADKFQLTARNRIQSDRSAFNATPAIADNQVFIRSNRYLYCIQK